MIVLNYNGKRLLSYCLPTLERLSYKNFKILVVDNGSTDGSVNLVRELFPEVTVIQSSRNMGWTGGNNIGIKYAKRLKADFVVLLNNDTKVHPHFLRTIAEFASTHPRAGVFAGKYYVMNTRILQAAGGGYFSKEYMCGKYLGKNIEDKGQFESPRRIDYVLEAALVARTSTFDCVGLIDPVWHFYYEGADFGKRTARFGIETWYVPNAIIEHEGGATFQENRPLRSLASLKRTATVIARNRFRFLLKHYDFRDALYAEATYIGSSLKEISVNPFGPLLELYSLLWNLLHIPLIFSIKKMRREDYDELHEKCLNECNVIESLK